MSIAEVQAWYDAIAAVDKERTYQDDKWGPISTHGHTLGEWLLILEAELFEAKTALIKGGEGRDSIRSELVQIAAVAMAALEQHGTEEPHNGRQV